MLCLHGVPDVPREPTDEAGLIILPLKMLQVPPNTFRVKLNLLGRASVGPSGGGGQREGQSGAEASQAPGTSPTLPQPAPSRARTS